MRAGFTLFEVFMAMLLMAIAVLSCVSLFPLMIKAQELARYRLYASAKAIELADALHQPHSEMGNNNKEQAHPSGIDYSVINRGRHQCDVERECEGISSGFFRLPDRLAQRIDSEHDEVRRVLDEGGALYYCSPIPTYGFADLGATAAAQDIASRRLPNEAQRLIFAVRGFAQQNAALGHPQIAWPYHRYYPVRPADIDWGAIGGSPRGPGLDGEELNVAPRSITDTEHFVWWHPWEWPVDINPLVSAYAAWKQGPTLATCTAYRDQAKALVAALSLTDPTTTGVIAPAPQTASGWAQLTGKNVLAYGALAHAALTVTRFSTAGGDVDAARFAHETSLAWAKAYAAEKPYDWGAPRPLNCTLMTDWPLLHDDLFAVDGRDPSQPTWQMLHPRERPDGFAFSGTWVAKAAIDAKWSGATQRYTLAKPFAASERCRQIVAFAVDWQSWEDAEEAPSATLDGAHTNYVSSRIASGLPFMNSGDYAGVWKIDHHAKSGNPECYLAWTNPSRDTRHNSISNRHGSTGAYLGFWGADRNGNGVLDHGPVPASTRLRAVTVARFNIYDPVLHLGLRR